LVEEKTFYDQHHTSFNFGGETVASHIYFIRNLGMLFLVLIVVIGIPSLL